MRRQSLLLERVVPGALFVLAFTWFSACGEDGGGAPGDLPACPPVNAGESVGEKVPEDGKAQGTVGSTISNTFDHFEDLGQGSTKDPFTILKELAEEGPEAVRTRLHSCGKIPYATVGTMLTSFGVDLARAGSGGVKSAGELYREGADMLGAARLDARDPEKPLHTTAGAARLFDIFVQAAPEIIAAMPTLPHCQLNGAGFEVFETTPEGATKCRAEPVTCLIGRPATTEDVALCDLVVAAAAPGDAADLETKKNIAVAAMLSAAHSCE